MTQKTFLLKTFILACTLLLVRETAPAECLTNSLNISTGYDPISGTVLTPTKTGTPDPHWSIFSMSPDVTALGLGAGVGTPAIVITPYPTIWATSTSSAWLSFFNGNAYPTMSDGTYVTTFRRTFSNCIQDNYVFNFTVADDNFMANVLVDGVPVCSGACWQNTPAPSNYSTFNGFGFGVNLAPGTHTLDIEVHNFATNQTANAYGFDLQGTITGHFNSIVSETSGCATYTCSCRNSSLDISTGYNPQTGSLTYTDLSYPGNQDNKWIISSLSSDCQAIAPSTPSYAAVVVPPSPAAASIPPSIPWISGTQSQWLSFYNGTDYATTSSGSYIMNLQRQFTNCLDDEFDLDIDVAADNAVNSFTVDGVSISGSLSVIGYSYWSHFTYSTGTLPAGTHTIEVSVESFAEDMSLNAHGFNMSGTIASHSGNSSLKNESDGCSLYSCSDSKQSNQVQATAATNALYQNKPNPVNATTEIDYSVVSMKQNAAIVVYNMLGRVVKEYPITQAGKGTITLNSSDMPTGLYLYSLVVDGKRIDSKRMSIQN